jgi:16S rRNA (cytosine1402-N4)-methyltransferase
MTDGEGGGDPATFRRRPRYRGTHPRTFADKYKERDPARYPEEREKVLAAGKTPAGSHVPVLVAEVLEALRPAPGETAVDATLGWGGHAEAILPKLRPGGRLIGLDADPVELPKTERRLRALGWDEEALVVRRSNFAGLPKVLHELGLPGVDLVLADLGVSSMQLDDPERGFSWKRDAPLDLRMNPQRGLAAGERILRMKKEEIEEVLREYGDEPEAKRIAEALLDALAARRREDPSAHPRTSDVAAAVAAAYEGKSERERREQLDASRARTFQALRIFVNDEMTALGTFLANLPAILEAGGRVAILSFHSGEDRRVKKAFTAGLASGVYAAVSPGVVRPSADERGANPRSAAAKLRWAVRAGRPLPG